MPEDGLVFHYPMYVIQAEDLLKLNCLIPHEEAVRRGLIRPVNEATDKMIIFWSHQWLGRDYPDPEDRQLKCMQSIVNKASSFSGFQAIIAGSEHTKSASDIEQQLGMSKADFIQAMGKSVHWVDYLSIPQDPSRTDEQTLAINCIPAYTAKSRLMIVLCPPSEHAVTGESCELSTWRKRGWCRLELMSMTWTHPRFPVMIAESPDSLRIGAELMPKKMNASQSACNGEFTCCQGGHMRQGSPVQCDKHIIYSVLDRLHRMYVSNVKAEVGEGLKWRWAKSLRHVVLAGTLQAEEVVLNSSLSKFLDDYSLSIGSLDEAGNTPLHWAAYVGNFESVCELLSHESAANLLDSRNRAEMHPDIHQYSLIAGAGVTPLMLAAERGFSNIVLALLVAGAEVNALATFGATALNLAATRGYTDCVSILLEREADVTTQLNSQSTFFGHCVGFTALHSAAIAGHTETVCLLLDSEADPNHASQMGVYPIHCAVAINDNVEIVNALLAAGADHTVSTSAEHPVESWKHVTAMEIANSSSRNQSMKRLSRRASIQTQFFTYAEDATYTYHLHDFDNVSPGSRSNHGSKSGSLTFVKT